MAEYTAAPGDVEMGLEERPVVLVEKKSSTRWIWNACTAIFIVALCLGGIVLFDLYWNKRPEPMTPSGQSEMLIEKDTAEKTDPHHMLRQISSKAKAAIHLEGSYDEEVVGSEEKLEWKNNQGQAFSLGGLQLVDNQISIPHTGLYFVYSQASFRVSCSDGDEEEAEKRLTVSHRIWRFSDSRGSKASLMNGVRSACRNTAQEDNNYSNGQGLYKTIYLGAVFQLHTGDRLWTETSQLSQLDTDEGKTFFGVFAL
uniref:Tumor necrosis factor n=1 Tax=Monopterus albus TaxID=43700 RepID=A0A3Q3IJQ5_MONAL|nr:tumor necrosis factor-like [Monopterus albus]